MKTIYWFVCGFLLGIIPALIIVQNHPIPKQLFLTKLVHFLEHAWNADITIAEATLNVFTGTVNLHDLDITHRDTPHARMHFKKVLATISPYSSVRDNVINIAITCHDTNIESGYHDGQFDVAALLTTILHPQLERLTAHAFILKNITARTVGLKKNGTLTMIGELRMCKDERGKWEQSIVAQDGTLSYDTHPIIQNFSGMTSIPARQIADEPLCATAAHRCTLPLLTADTPIFLRGVWNERQKEVRLCDNTDTLNVTLSYSHDRLIATGRSTRIPLFNMVHITSTQMPMGIACTFTLENEALNLTGNAFWNRNTQTTRFSLTNTTSIPLGNAIPYTIDPYQLPITGTIMCDGTVIIRNKNKIVGQIKKKSDTIRYRFSYAYLRSLLPAPLRHQLLGHAGTVHGTVTTGHDITGTFNFADGNLSIPSSYNGITHAHGSFTYAHDTMTIRDVVVQLYKGRITSKHICICKNFIHAPLTIENILINWKKDLLGIVYGTLMLEQQNTSPFSATGNLVLKKSLLKENIFAQNTASSFSLPKATCIRIETEHPIHAKTDVLDAHALCDFSLNGPDLSGCIIITDGTVRFLRNTLNIRPNSKINFLPNQTDNPLIDLSAQNHIKKYLITVQASGFLQNPTITLDARPELTEEQIIALLFSGSENAQLQTDFPAMIMKNFTTLLIGKKQTLPKTISFFERITRPLEYIQITPDFTDQTGRGGIKGTVTIDVTKQLHAHVQKNFSLQDDFSFDVEYLLSDDISTKIVKDYRGDLGGEIEIRLKL